MIIVVAISVLGSLIGVIEGVRIRSIEYFSDIFYVVWFICQWTGKSVV